jgi:hypothetical protein
MTIQNVAELQETPEYKALVSLIVAQRYMPEADMEDASKRRHYTLLEHALRDPTLLVKEMTTIVQERYGVHP